MRLRKVTPRAGAVVGIGAVVSSFGLVTPAHAYTCDATIAPNKADFVAAVADGDLIVCITEGTMDMGLGAVGENGPVTVDRDITVVGIGDVTIDGNDESPSFLLGQSETDADIDITLDNLTVTNFRDWGYDDYVWGTSKYVPVVGLNRNASGTITVLNSVFESNNSYLPMVAAIDQDEDEPSQVYGDIVIDNSIFRDNTTFDEGIVWGYGNIAVSNSSFTDNSANDGIVESWTDDSRPNSTITFEGNLVYGNLMQSPALNLDAVETNVFNNTFAENTSTSDYGGTLKVVVANTVNFAFNTLINNDSSGATDLWIEAGGGELNLLGNIIQSSDDETISSSVDSTINDLGGNFSTANDALVLDNPTSESGVDPAVLELNELADNGGSTLTIALGATSVAQNAVAAELATELFGFEIDTDQRGEARDELLNAGAWDDGSAELAATGFDAPGLALLGGVIGAAGVALATRRRRP